MNAVQNMRERMVVFENRISTMEQQQQVFIARDSSEVSIKDQVVGMEERIKQLEAQQVELENISMKMAAPPEQPAAVEKKPDAEPEGVDALFPDEGEEPEADSPWYLTWWFLAMVFGVIGLAAAGAVLILKRKKGGNGAGSSGDGDGLANVSGFEEADDLMDELPDDLPELETVDDET
ncbi:MAG: hypothetical protein O3B73_05615 [bacterium]|nr:hypothetical protein [bacterium]